jgi:hypothetical protein
MQRQHKTCKKLQTWRESSHGLDGSFVYTVPIAKLSPLNTIISLIGLRKLKILIEVHNNLYF